MENTMHVANDTTPAPAVRFFYNGFKVGAGPLQKSCYSAIESWHTGTRQIPTHIAIYAGNGLTGRFSADVREAFAVVNNSHGRSDYNEADRIRLTVDHPLFLAAAEAAITAILRDIARCEKSGKAGAAKGYRNDLTVLARVVASRKAVR